MWGLQFGLMWGLQFGLAVCLGWDKHLNEWKVYGNTIYYLENGLYECVCVCVCVCVRNILVRGLEFGFAWLRNICEFEKRMGIRFTI